MPKPSSCLRKQPACTAPRPAPDADTTPPHAMPTVLVPANSWHSASLGLSNWQPNPPPSTSMCATVWTEIFSHPGCSGGAGASGGGGGERMSQTHT